MKKFYESPVVEITVFDVEDVITASVFDTREMGVDDLNALVTNINNTKGQAVEVIDFTDTGAYTW
jgi:hypothetical protein